MSQGRSEKNRSRKAARKDRAAEVANTFEWLITAFILAFVFRAFIMEAFRIPTGSMADTLKGAHFRLRCRQCGYKYDYGFDSRRLGGLQDSIPGGNVRAPLSRCASCGHYDTDGGAIPVSNGDRILVLKCIYQFLEPRQWDVVVFKNPLDPPINYIKRLIGRPGETVEIIDGDIYIDGQISRKPSKVQDELWMPVYNNDYQPVRPSEPTFNRDRKWEQPFKKIADSKWRLDEVNPTEFLLDSPVDKINSLIYDTSIGNNFRATYAYDDVKGYDYMPYCSDLMVHFYSQPTYSEGRIGIALSKYKIAYRAWVDFTGAMVIEGERGKEIVELAYKSIAPVALNKSTPVKFANVDHQLIFQFGSERLTYDLGRGPDDAGERKADIPPQVEIFGSGKLTISHVTIFRDIHYIAKKFGNRSERGRATEGKPFTLGKDEFFVLGDNSPNSEDGRWWRRPGRGNKGISYEPGIVPRDYLVGKALFVYWPGGFKPFARSRFAIIPNVGQMRFIHGGSPH
ncbi:MAG: signal peptidase I [Planctomycetota bacterium]|jgi:signal peptidase I